MRKSARRASTKAARNRSRPSRKASGTGKRSRKSAAAAGALSPAGSRVGNKRRDMRWEAPDGTIWASRFEYAVYSTLKAQGYNVRKSTAEDRFPYTDPVTNGRCLECNSARCVTDRGYTPDLFIGPPGEDLGPASERVRGGDANTPWGYFIEAKGYLRSDRRSLLRSFRKSWPSLNFRLVVQRDYKVTAKLTIAQWAVKYLRVPVTVWDGRLPDDWNVLPVWRGSVP